MFVTHRFYLNQDTVDEIKSLKPNFGYNGFSEFIFYRTYSRIKPDGTQENWADVVIRVMNGTFSIRKDWYLKNHIEWDEDFWQHYAQHMALSLFRMEWMPPGRGLWAMGTDFVYERGSMALQNCGLRLIGDDIGADISWIMDALMTGVGIGAIPTRNDDLVIYTPQNSFTYVIPDSREGWCHSVRILIDSFLESGLERPEFDYSEIRKAGLPIKGFGGISSGPEPLALLHQQIITFFEMFQNLAWYDSILLKTDITNAVGCMVVSGNIRRSAELISGNIDDIIDLKDYEKYPYREMFGWMSNNSVNLDCDADFDRLGEIAERIKKNGEPGYINRMNLKYGRIGKSMEGLRPDPGIGLNPCSNRTSKFLTPYGIRNLEQLDAGDTIWSECGWTKIIKKWSTGINKVYNYHTTAGVFTGTENHRVLYDGMKVEVKYAPGIDVLRGPVPNVDESIWNELVMDGLVLGDGMDDHGRIVLIIGENDQDYFDCPEINHLIGKQITTTNRYIVETSIKNLPKTYEREVPDYILMGDAAEVRSFLRGLYSANGSVVHNRVQLKTASFKLMRQVQMMLSSIGIKSYFTTNKEHNVTHRTGDYISKESYDLAIADDRERFMLLIGFIQKYKQDSLLAIVNNTKRQNKYKETFDIVEVEYLGEEETFDITVDNQLHTYWNQCCNVSNCGEQVLCGEGETCTLVETCPTVCNDYETWLKSCEYATTYASTVTLLLTHSTETNAIMIKNRRIGVGIIDVAGWKKEIGTTRLIKYLREGYKKVRAVNTWLNNEAGVPEAIRVTTIKPGGTIPKVVGKRSGWQNPTFGLTLRRVRVARNQSIYNILHDAGIPHEPDVFSANTDCFEWPIDQSDGGRIKPVTEVSLWEQAMMLVLLQREWSDNAVSNTLYFKPKWMLVENINIGSSFYYDSIDTNHLIKIGDILPLDMTWEDFLETQEIENDQVRIVLKQDQYTSDWEFKVYRYDTNHEEDDIENVLAAIAPLTKSVSMLPHSPKGVYRQMPEEGITREEYENRLAQIKKIDWSTLSNSDGIDEKYCMGPHCEIPNQKVME